MSLDCLFGEVTQLSDSWLSETRDRLKLLSMNIKAQMAAVVCFFGGVAGIACI